MRTIHFTYGQLFQRCLEYLPGHGVLSDKKLEHTQRLSLEFQYWGMFLFNIDTYIPLSLEPMPPLSKPSHKSSAVVLQVASSDSYHWPSKYCERSALRLVRRPVI